MRSLTVLVSIALVVNAPVAAASSETEPMASQPSATSKPEKVRCKRVDVTPAGTNLKKFARVCNPKSEWNPSRIAFERSLEAMKDRGLVDPGSLMQPGTSPR